MVSIPDRQSSDVAPVPSGQRPVPKHQADRTIPRDDLPWLPEELLDDGPPAAVEDDRGRYVR